jgi:Ribbon-helix-helix domain
LRARFLRRVRSALFSYDRCISVFLLRCIDREPALRWNIKVSKETDLALRSFLGSQGMKKGDLSKFIEQAVRAHVFHRTVQDIKARNADTDPEELQALIDQAVHEVRTEKRSKRPRSKTRRA